MPSSSAPSYDPAAEYMKGVAALNGQKYKEAERALSNVVEAAPKNADAWRLLGMANAGQNDLKGARRAYERAVKLEPDNIQGRQGLGVALGGLKDAKAQEQLDWRERAFLTVAARVDKNSAFGRNNGTTVYPSANASYVISEEPWFPRVPGLDRLRLRTSIGQAGLPPATTAALQFLSALTYPASAGEAPGLTVQSVGNADLKPEVTSEVEAGFDAGIIRDRVNLEFNASSLKR